MWHLKSKIKAQTKQEQTHRYSEQMVLAGGEGGGLAEKVQGLESTDWQSQKSHGCKHRD